MGEVAQFTGGKVPQKLKDVFGGDNTDLSSGVRGGYSVLSIRGSRWHVKVGDDETTVTNEDGDAVGSLRLVLLKASPNVSKNYYSKNYEEGSSEGPTCWSIDGVRPDPGADKQADSCAVCPKNVFGSRITETGTKAKACADSRRVAVIPEGDFKNDVYGGPMLLRVPASSLSNLATYGKKMDKQGFPYNTIITRVSFDHSVAFPKLEFNAVRPLNDEEADEIIQLLNDPEFSGKIEAVLAKDLEVVAVDDEEEDDKPLFEEPPAPTKAAKKKKSPKKAESKSEAETEPETVEKDESDDELDDELTDILSSLDNLD